MESVNKAKVNSLCGHKYLCLLQAMVLLQCATADAPAPKEVIPQDIVATAIIPPVAIKKSEVLLGIREDYPHYSGLFDALLHETLGDEAASAGAHQLALENYTRALSGNSPAYITQIYPKLVVQWVHLKATKAKDVPAPTADRLANELVDMLAQDSGATDSLAIFEKHQRQSLAAYIQKHHQAAIAQSEIASSIAPPERVVIPPPSDAADPLFLLRMQAHCDQRILAGHDEWLGKLSALEGQYWQGLVLGCTKKLEAIELLAAFVLKVTGKKDLEALRLGAARKIVEFYRAEGNRALLPEYYQMLSQAWNDYKGSAANIGMTAYVMALTRIQDDLWTSRYRSLIGDYQQSSELAQLAIKNLSNIYANHSIQSQKDHQELAILRAEAYHILAFRIAIEKQQLDSAIAHTNLALTTPHLTQEWLEILHWHLGLYHYLNGDFPQAIQSWGAIVKGKRVQEWPDRELYWMARAHFEMGQMDNAKELLNTLLVGYPLGYYSIVALESYWQKIPGLQRPPIAARDQLIAGFQDVDKLKAEEIRAHPSLGKLLARLELLLNYGLADLAGPAYLDFESALKSVWTNHKHPPAYVYMTRLAHGAGFYRKSIFYNDQLAKLSNRYWQDWPEQLLLSYPRPFIDAYQRQSMDTGVEVETMLAITRQESLFDAAAASPAGAFGLMQIIPETAKRFAAEVGIRLANPATDLLRPDFNLKIGARYLRHLERHYAGLKPAVFAAYNAGEGAVDAWVKRRVHADPTVWVELIPYGETRNYVKKVWSNDMLYKRLTANERISMVVK